MESPRFKLTRADLKSIFVGLGIATSGAAVTYLSEVVTEINWGDWTPAVVALASVLVNVARKWLADKS